jgi:hypothetical protein
MARVGATMDNRSASTTPPRQRNAATALVPYDSSGGTGRLASWDQEEYHLERPFAHTFSPQHAGNYAHVFHKLFLLSIHSMSQLVSPRGVASKAFPKRRVREIDVAHVR